MRILCLVALLPVAITVAFHQVVPGLPLPHPDTVRPFAIGPYDHVAPLDIFGLTGIPALLVIVGMFFAAVVLFVGGGRIGTKPTRLEWAGFGFLGGGLISNGGEVTLRGAVMDWVWFSPDGISAIIFNTADVALVTGGVLIFGRFLRETVATVTELRFTPRSR